MKKPLLSLLLLAAACTAFSQTNKALSLNGTSTYASIGTPIPAGSSYTKEAWVNLYAAIGACNIASSFNTPFWIADGVLKGGQGGNYAIVSDPSTIPVNTWTYVALTYDASTGTMKLYRNGSLVSTATGVPAYSQEATYIGSHQGTQSFYKGNIDEVRIWSRALPQAELKKNMFRGPATNATSLVQYFTFNSDPASVVTNACTNGTAGNGTLSNGSYVASPVGFSANALAFDGTNDYVDLGTSSTLKPSSALSVELWAKSANWNVASEQELISCFEVGGYGIYLSGGNLRFELWPSGGSAYAGVSYPVSNLTNGSWVHIAGTFDGRYIRLYVNGALIGTNDLGTTKTIYYQYPANNFMIGADAGQTTSPSGFYFNGQLDEVRLWSVARTQAQIQANMSRELDPTDATQTTGLNSYYAFNQGLTAGTNTEATSVVDLVGANHGTLVNFSLSGSSSNYVAQQNTIVVLPLQWLSFTAGKQGEKARLQWSVAGDDATTDFAVQQSTNAKDWTTLATIPYTPGQQAYGFTAAEQKGFNYYRVAQHNKSNQTSYTAVRALRFGTLQSAFRILGNTVQTTLQLDVQTSCVLRLYNADGKLVKQLQAAEGYQAVDVSGFSKGIYYLAGGGTVEKLAIQ